MPLLEAATEALTESAESAATAAGADGRYRHAGDGRVDERRCRGCAGGGAAQSERAGYLHGTEASSVTLGAADADDPAERPRRRRIRELPVPAQELLNSS